MKNNNYLLKLLAAMMLFVVPLITSCTETEAEETTPTLSLSTATLEFDFDGVSTDDFGGAVEVSSNRDWVVSIPESVDWLSVDTTQGSGNGSLLFSVPATTAARYANVTISIYNDYGVILSESLVVSQGTSSGSVTLNGDELPTSYGTSTIVVGSMEFGVENVANFSSSYDVTGPIQFKGGVEACLYNNVEFMDLTKVVVTLSNDYNNFTVYAGSTAKTQDTAIEPVTDGSTVTYTLPEGATFVSIYNHSSYAAYANYIEFLCGDDESSVEDNSGNGNDDGGGTTTDDATLLITTASGTLSDYTTYAGSYVGVMEFSGASFYLNEVYAYYDYVSMGTTTGYLYNLTSLEGLTKVVVSYKDSNYLNVYEGSEANPTATLIEPTVDGTVCTYTITSGNTFITLSHETSSYVNINSIGFYYDSLGDTSAIPDDGGSDDGGTTTDDATLLLTTASGSLSDYSSYSTSYVGSMVFSEASFYLNEVYSYYDYISLGTNSGYIYNLTAFEGLTKVVVSYKDSNYLNVYEGSEANPTSTLIEPTVDGTVCTYTITSGNKYVTLAHETSSYVNINSIGFYYDSLGDTTTAPGDGGSDDGGSDDGGSSTTTSAISDAANIANVGNSFKVSGTVVAACTAGVIVSDETASIYLYGYNYTYAIGDVITIEGPTSSYSGAAQFTASACTITVDSSTTVTYPTPTVMSASDFDTFVANVSVQYVEYSGTLKISGSYINVVVDGANYTLSINASSSDYTSLDGVEVTVTGYLTGYYNSYIYTVATSVVAK